MRSKNADKTIFLRHESGATHALRGRQLVRLLRELKEGRGMPELVRLIESGYTETLGGVDLGGENLAEALQAEADGRVSQ